MSERLRELYPLHTDAEGNGLLVGPDCPDCLRRSVAEYRCKRCDLRFFVPGEFRWSWQGKGHWHRADDQADVDVMIEHIYTHEPHSVIAVSYTHLRAHET